MTTKQTKYSIEVIQGIPYIVDNEQRVYYYDSEKPDIELVQLGKITEESYNKTENGSGRTKKEISREWELELFDDWEERIRSKIESWRGELTEHERGKIPVGKKPQKNSNKSRKSEK